MGAKFSQWKKAHPIWFWILVIIFTVNIFAFAIGILIAGILTIWALIRNKKHDIPPLEDIYTNKYLWVTSIITNRPIDSQYKIFKNYYDRLDEDVNFADLDPDPKHEVEGYATLMKIQNRMNELEAQWKLTEITEEMTEEVTEEVTTEVKVAIDKLNQFFTDAQEGMLHKIQYEKYKESLSNELKQNPDIRGLIMDIDYYSDMDFDF